MEDNKINKITSIFLIISAICLIAIWLIMYFTGQINDFFEVLHFKNVFLLISEFITALLLFISGISFVVFRKKYYGLRQFSLGMLFYAILIGIGEFADRKIYIVTALFLIVAICTIMISLNGRALLKLFWKINPAQDSSVRD